MRKGILICTTVMIWPPVRVIVMCVDYVAANQLDICEFSCIIFADLASLEWASQKQNKENGII